MKILCLNTWGGKLAKPLLDFVAHHKDVDVFCFQEVYNGPERPVKENEPAPDLFTKIQEALPDHVGFFSEAVFDKVWAHAPYGIATFVKKDISVISQRTIEIFQLEDAKRIGLKEGLELWNRLMDETTLVHNEKELTVFNLHGIFTGGDMSDCAGRSEQTRIIRRYTDEIKGEKLLCGDLNMNPDTECFKNLKQNLRDLIDEFGITTTRNKYYSNDLKFADYILLSPSLEVKKFEVLEDEVSDHLPLLLEIS